MQKNDRHNITVQGSLFETDEGLGQTAPADSDQQRAQVGEYVRSLQNAEGIGEQIVYHRVLPDATAEYADNQRPWPKAIADVLARRGISSLYAHQTLATDIVRSGRHVVVATPTASGKSMVYNLPVIERFLQDRDSRALYLFPLKALAQDQHKAFEELTAHWPKAARPGAAIYDGDTTPHFRKKIRNNPPAVLMTNPEMLHLSLLPHHERWVQFFASLQFIVVDEVHTYRGVMGSHMAQVFRRLLRVCAHYGVQPTFVFSSATIGNPAALCHDLTGVDVEVISESGAPQGKRHMVFLNPWDSPSSAAIALLKAALARGMRTIVYTQSRKMTELISMWAQEKSGVYKGRISAYRAGFLPEERRDIEAKMASGELLAVISTSALELGIDIGSLDLCILVGYPGTVMSTLQRGGRVGRARQDAAVVLVAGEDALDQYFMRHPQDFFDRPAEHALLNPYNPVVLKKHLECAAAELPLRTAEPWLENESVLEAVSELEQQGQLLRDAEGSLFFAARKRPQRHVDLRSSGQTFHIQGSGGQIIGSVDGHKAFRETHPGAVYLHRGKTWHVTALDITARTVQASPGKGNYYTRVRSNKKTDILDVVEQRVVWGTRVCFGRLRVTETIVGYEKRNVRGGTLLGIVPLDLPPLVFETEGLWFEIPSSVQQHLEGAFLHFMGAIHAVEHAAIGILPLLVMTDRNDLGGISTPMHSQVGKPAVFIYDGMPGGAGLTREAFTQAEQVLTRTLAAISDCDCELGCPSCVHSPKCGSGNRPIDKFGARVLLETLQSSPPDTALKEPFIVVQGTEDTNEIESNAQANRMSESSTNVMYFVKHTENASRYVDSVGQEEVAPESLQEPARQDGPDRVETAEPLYYCVVDVETQRSAKEVGGWHRAEKMGVSVAVLYDSAEDTFIHYTEEQVGELTGRLRLYDAVIGFNSVRFDYKVLSAYATYDLQTLPSLDLLQVITRQLSYRVSLDNLGSATLDAPKSASGLKALQWWKEGAVDKIARYCEQDVAITRDLYRYGKQNGYVLFRNKAGKRVRVPVDW